LPENASPTKVNILQAKTKEKSKLNKMFK